VLILWPGISVRCNICYRCSSPGKQSQMCYKACGTDWQWCWDVL